MEKIVKETFEQYGAHQIQTPTLVNMKSILMKTFQLFAQEMITIDYVSKKGDKFALRPAFTTSVVASDALGELEQAPSPHKTYYFGQCFRLITPQSFKYREFCQAGIEIIGSNLPIADAEVIALAMRVLKKMGISSHCKLKIGNIGILRTLLSQNNIEDDEQEIVLGDFKMIGRIREKCKQIPAKLPLSAKNRNYVKEKVKSFSKIQSKFEYEGEHKISSINNFDNKTIINCLTQLPRIAEDTYKNKLQKLIGDNFSDDLFNTLVDITSIEGEEQEVINYLDEKLGGYSAIKSFENLKDVLKHLNYHDINNYILHPCMIRGLGYYTGTVFEIYCDLLEATDNQICGGGRYDTLYSVVTDKEKDFPAVGFAFGFDRLVGSFIKGSEFKKENFVKYKPDIMVISASEKHIPKVIEIAEILRNNGHKVLIDLNQEDLKTQFIKALKSSCKYCIFVGLKEVDFENEVKVKNLEKKQQEIVRIEDLVAYFRPP